MKKILCVGEMVIDFLPGNEEASYIRKAGGAPANVAIAAARQGCDAAFCGMMGNDVFGRFLYKTLEENRVEPVVKELTLFPAGIAQKAHAIGAKVVHIGSNPNSPLKEIACLMVRIPVRTKYYLEDEIDSRQPMTSLFEQTLMLLGDVVAKMIIDRKELDMKGLWQYHANLE